MKYKILFILISSLLLFFLGSVPAASALSSTEVCNDINDVVKILDCGSKDIVSFSGFQGGLQAPSGQGLDTTLTRAKTAREFIVNTVNFALTFLGIIALVIVIYGGFLYITAAGNEEQSTKGKKSITYAVVGILIIIASFAIVNTLLTFGGGKTTDRGGAAGSGARGVGEEGSNIGQQIIYNLGAAEINSSLNDFVAAYRNLVTINGLYKKLQTLPPPIERGENRNYINEIANLVTEIKNNTNVLSKTRQIAARMLDEYLFGLQSAAATILSQEKFEVENDDLGMPTGSKLQKEVVAKLQNEFNILQASKEDFLQAIDLLIGPPPPVTERPKTEKVSGKLPIVWKIMGPVADETNVQQTIDRGLVSEKDLQRAFAGIDPNITVGQLFLEALKNLDRSRDLANNTSNTNLLIDAVKALDRLYVIVKDIKFTFVRIRASVKEGNAPLIVELNGLDSRDPSGQTILPENYKWDPDGDGVDGIKSGGGGFAAVECADAKTQAPVITCTYNQPGTYVARLSIASRDPNHIASGQAFLPITVQPNIARIGLKASVGTLSEDIRKYEKDARGAWNLAIDKNEFHVTAEEAKNTGVSFDGSSSQGGTNQTLKNFSWSFGDGSTVEEGPNKNKIDNHKYKKEGKYPLKLEVTDTGNRKDRKLVNIIVSTLAARIGAKQTIGEPDALMEFDGSLSRSDHGAINSYQWTILDKDGVDVTNLQNALSFIGAPSGSVLRVKFKRPGSYTVRLAVSDGSNTDKTEVPVAIRSRKPRANFTIKTCPISCPDKTKPGVVDFDASMSFDPDPGDKLTYAWEFFNALGDKLEPRTGFLIEAPGQLSGPQAKRLRVKFLSVGKFKAVLRVNDSHVDPNILQEDVKEKEFEITSVVEASWSPRFNPVATLKDGNASFAFSGTITNATQAHIDFGDSTIEDKVADPQNLNGNVWNFEFKHDYAKSGSYVVMLTATSEEGKGENTITKRIYVASGGSPLAVMEVSVDNVPVTQETPTRDDPKPAISVIRKKIITFDASNSVDSEGRNIGNTPDIAKYLKYSWDFGDGKPGSTGMKVQRAYQDLSPEDSPYTVKLTVTEVDGNKISESEFYVKVVSVKPEVNTLSLEKKTSGEITPIDVLLTAEGANDPDGKITNYQFWYYDPADKEKRFAIVDTQNNTATLTVETNGEEDEEHEYFFCVTITDNENFTSECSDLFQENELPKLKVKNGPNQAPSASFAADQTSVKVNEPITFTSSSRDTDGRIVKYIWDLEGDGFQNDNPTELSTITHRYLRRSPLGGYRMKLKIIDDKGAAGFSREIPIHVDVISKPPVANFIFQVDPAVVNRVRFFDSSTADREHDAKLVKWKWDFDTAQEYGCNENPKPAHCNGDKTDDADSTEQNPVFDYPDSGTHQVKLIVEDSSDSVSQPKIFIINVIAGARGGTGTSSAALLEANLKPITNPQTGARYEFETLRNERRKVLHIPADANGADVTLFWGDSAGDILKYQIDKNVWCDSNGDGNIANDVDNPDIVIGKCTDAATGREADHCWTTNYQRYAKTGHPPRDANGFGLPGNFEARLTVVDRQGNTDTDTVNIVFDGQFDPEKIRLFRTFDCNGKPASLGGANLFRQLGMRNIILLSILAGVIVVLIGFGITNLVKGGKTRI